MSETENQEQQTTENQQEESQNQEDSGLNETIANMLNGVGNEDTLKAQIELVNKMTLRARDLIDQTTADDLVMIAKTLEILGGKNSILKITQLLTEALKQIEADKTEALKQIEADKTEALKQIEADKTEALKQIEASKEETFSLVQNLNSLLYHENHGLTTV